MQKQLTLGEHPVASDGNNTVKSVEWQFRHHFRRMALEFSDQKLHLDVALLKNGRHNRLKNAFRTAISSHGIDYDQKTLFSFTKNQVLDIKNTI
jgi:hypothetical protein